MFFFILVKRQGCFWHTGLRVGYHNEVWAAINCFSICLLKLHLLYCISLHNDYIMSGEFYINFWFGNNYRDVDNAITAESLFTMEPLYYRHPREGGDGPD